jgi:hypothetical protein
MGVRSPFTPTLSPLEKGGYREWGDVIPVPFAIKNLLNGERFWRRPALRAGRRASTGPPLAEGERRPHKIPPTRIQKLFASSWYYANNEAK